MLPSLRERFQVRLYRMGGTLERIASPEALKANLPSTDIAGGLKQLVTESSALPVGAVVLLSDGSDNAGGVDTATLADLKARQIPIHTVGFGREQIDHDVELMDVQTPASAFANSRVVAQVSFRQRGFAGKRAKVSIRDGNTVLAMREVSLGSDGSLQTESLIFQSGNAGVRTMAVSIDPVPGEENTGNNRMLRVMDVDAAKPRILYVEGEPRWEFKFIRRAMDEDQTVQLVTLLRATQNKNYRQGIADPKELDEGFPSKREELFGIQRPGDRKRRSELDDNIAA